MNVLLIGHACGPALGSEPGNTWNWAQLLSLKHRTWVIAHPQRREAVEQHLIVKPNPNLRFIWATISQPFDPWMPERGERGIRIHYILWLSEAYKRARELCRSTQIDVAHHVSLGTISAPPPLWRLPVATVWGPIGGGQTAAPAFLRFFGQQRWAERIRTARVRALRLSPRLRKTVRRCDAIFATNRDTADLLIRAGGSRIEMLLDCGLPEADVPAQLPASITPKDDFRVLWAGRLEYRKGLALGLHALARVNDARVRLLVAGGGPQQEELRSLTQELGLEERITFLGAVPHDRMPGLLQMASAFLFTSLRDSFGSVVLEAMAHGLPVITLDHQGVGTFVPDEAAIKVTVSDPDQTIADLASAIRNLAASPDLLERMRVAAWNFARHQTWDRRVARMTEVYEALANLQRGPAFNAVHQHSI